MNFQPVKTIFVIIVAFLLFCHRIVQSDPILGTKNVTGTNTRIMKAFLMHCSENLTNHNNIQVTVQIAVHSPSKTVITLYFLLSFSISLYCFLLSRETILLWEKFSLETYSIQIQILHVI